MSLQQLLCSKWPAQGFQRWAATSYPFCALAIDATLDPESAWEFAILFDARYLHFCFLRWNSVSLLKLWRCTYFRYFKPCDAHSRQGGSFIYLNLFPHWSALFVLSFSVPGDPEAVIILREEDNVCKSGTLFTMFALTALTWNEFGLLHQDAGWLACEGSYNQQTRTATFGQPRFRCPKNILVPDWHGWSWNIRVPISPQTGAKNWCSAKALGLNVRIAIGYEIFLWCCKQHSKVKCNWDQHIHIVLHACCDSAVIVSNEWRDLHAQRSLIACPGTCI